MALSRFETFEILRQLMAAYPGFAPKVPLADMVEAYCIGLKDAPPAAVRRGAISHLGGKGFFPSLWELREASERAMRALGKSHPLWMMADDGQRFQDEVAGYAKPLLTKDPEGEWSPGEVEEFGRLVGVKPLMARR